MTNNF